MMGNKTGGHKPPAGFVINKILKVKRMFGLSYIVEACAKYGVRLLTV